MKCPTCKSDLAVLFTSTYCPVCDGARVSSEPSMYFGYIRTFVPTREVTPGYSGMVFDEVDKARSPTLSTIYVTKVASNKPISYWPDGHLYAVVEALSPASSSCEIVVVGEA